MLKALPDLLEVMSAALFESFVLVGALGCRVAVHLCVDLLVACAQLDLPEEIVLQTPVDGLSVGVGEILGEIVVVDQVRIVVR